MWLMFQQITFTLFILGSIHYSCLTGAVLLSCFSKPIVLSTAWGAMVVLAPAPETTSATWSGIVTVASSALVALSTTMQRGLVLPLAFAITASTTTLEAGRAIKLALGSSIIISRLIFSLKMYCFKRFSSSSFAMVLVTSPFRWGEQLLRSLGPIHRHPGEQICWWFWFQSIFWDRHPRLSEIIFFLILLILDCTIWILVWSLQPQCNMYFSVFPIYSLNSFPACELLVSWFLFLENSSWLWLLVIL